MTEITVPEHELLTNWTWKINDQGVRFRAVELAIGLLIIIEPLVLDLRQLCLLRIAISVPTIEDIKKLKIWVELKHILIVMVKIRNFLTSKYDLNPNYIIPVLLSAVGKNLCGGNACS